MSRDRRDLLLGALRGLPVVLLGASLREAHAQADWRRVAVPLFTPEDFVAGVLRHHASPRAVAFETSARRLADAARAWADGGGAGTVPALQQAWLSALRAWVALNALAIGPLVQRRSARRIDFSPTRAEQVRRAIEGVAAAPSPFDAELIGSAAKGFGALEWLLWHREAPRDAAAARYAAVVADDVAAEASALSQAFASTAERERSDEDTVTAFTEIINQWIGGLEALRLQHFERPRTEALRRSGARAVLPRSLASAAVAERQARWDALQAITRFAAGTPIPRPGQGLVSIETLLRGRGLNPLADRIVLASKRADAALTAASDSSPALLQAASRTLADLKCLAEAEVAARLDVRVGFSDADGD